MILCTLFSMWCAASPTPTTRFYDVVVNMPPCQMYGDDASSAISAAIKETQRIQQLTTPFSDAAAFSTEGASVALRFPPCTYKIKEAVYWGPGGSITLDGAHLYADYPAEAALVIQQAR